MTIKFPDSVTKLEALRALWVNSRPASFFISFHLSVPDFNPNEIFKNGTTYVDYCCGRVIKTDFKNYPILEERGYDRDNGKGAMEKVRDNFSLQVAAEQGDITARDNFEDNCEVQWAFCNGNLETVKYLHEHGADN